MLGIGYINVWVNKAKIIEKSDLSIIKQLKGKLNAGKN